VRVAGAAGRAFAVVARRLARPTPAGHEVVVRVVGAGASHADVHIQDEPLDVALPVVLGHEIAWVAGRYGPRHSADQRRLGGPAWPRRERPIPTSAVPVQDRQGPGSSPFR